MNLHLAHLPAHAGYPKLPPLTAAQRAIAERLTAKLDDVVTARRDQIDMVARLATGDGRISTRAWPHGAEESMAALVSDAVYDLQDALDLAILQVLETDDLDLVRRTDIGDKDGMRGAALDRLAEIQAPTIGDEHAEHRLTVFDAGVGRYAR